MNKMKRTLLKTLVFGGAASVLASNVLIAQDITPTPAPEGASVAIISPLNGATVPTEFTVIFGLEGMGVAPAGVDMPNTGHHHLLVDQTTLPEAGVPMGNPPLHFGAGQTQVTLTLEPGKHTLQLILGDKLHIPHNPPIVSEVIEITVEE